MFGARTFPANEEQGLVDPSVYITTLQRWAAWAAWAARERADARSRSRSGSGSGSGSLEH